VRLIDDGRECYFLDNRSQRCDLRVDFVPLSKTTGGRMKAFAMSDASQHRRVQAKLKKLIERASSAADANLHRRRKPYPLGFAVRLTVQSSLSDPKTSKITTRPSRT
jgi:hypothetical protein